MKEFGKRRCSSKAWRCVNVWLKARVCICVCDPTLGRDEGPRLPSSDNSPALLKRSPMSYRLCRFPPPPKVGSLGPPVPRAARTNKEKSKLFSSPPVTCTPKCAGRFVACGLPGLDRGPRLPRSDDSPAPHAFVRVSSTAEAAEPVSRLHHDNPATPRRRRRSGEHSTAHQLPRTVTAVKAQRG